MNGFELKQMAIGESPERRVLLENVDPKYTSVPHSSGPKPFLSAGPLRWRLGTLLKMRQPKGAPPSGSTISWLAGGALWKGWPGRGRQRRTFWRGPKVLLWSWAVAFRPVLASGRVGEGKRPFDHSATFLLGHFSSSSALVHLCFGR